MLLIAGCQASSLARIEFEVEAGLIASGEPLVYHLAHDPSRAGAHIEITIWFRAGYGEGEAISVIAN